MLQKPDPSEHTQEQFQRINSCHNKQKGKGQPSSNKPIKWLTEHQNALDQLIDCLSSPLILAYPEHDPVMLDWELFSTNVKRVLCVSYPMLPALYYLLKNDTICTQACLTLNWAVCNEFRDLLYYAASFTICTDNNPLTYGMKSAFSLYFYNQILTRGM